MNVRQVRKKIKSVSNVKKITRSMQLVSAIKMRKSQQAAIEAKPFQSHLDLIIKKIMTKIGGQVESPLLVSHAPESAPDLVIIISSNKGLCGSFNIDIFRYMASNIDLKHTKFLALGKKGAQFVSKTSDLLADYSSTTPLLTVSAINKLVMDEFLKGTYKRAFILFNRFISTLKTETSLLQILPYKLDITHDIETKEYIEYVIEPNPQDVLNMVLKSFVEEKLRDAVVQSEAGEHSARMVAMKNATDNANDVIYNLTLLGNKLRQEKITNELLDMVTAKESVEAG